MEQYTNLILWNVSGLRIKIYVAVTVSDEEATAEVEAVGRSMAWILHIGRITTMMKTAMINMTSLGDRIETSILPVVNGRSGRRECDSKVY